MIQQTSPAQRADKENQTESHGKEEFHSRRAHRCADNGRSNCSRTQAQRVRAVEGRTWRTDRTGQDDVVSCSVQGTGETNGRVNLRKFQVEFEIELKIPIQMQTRWMQRSSAGGLAGAWRRTRACKSLFLALSLRMNLPVRTFE